MIIYDRSLSALKLIDRSLDISAQENRDYTRRVAAGEETASIEGSAVFQYLEDVALKTAA